jgi:hypothetical protein
MAQGDISGQGRGKERLLRPAMKPVKNKAALDGRGKFHRSLPMNIAVKAVPQGVYAIMHENTIGKKLMLPFNADIIHPRDDFST